MNEGMTMFDVRNYVKQMYNVVSPKASFRTRELLTREIEYLSEDDLQDLLRHLLYECKNGNGDSELCKEIMNYLGITHFDFI